MFRLVGAILRLTNTLQQDEEGCTTHNCPIIRDLVYGVLIEYTYLQEYNISNKARVRRIPLVQVQVWLDHWPGWWKGRSDEAVPVWVEMG
jgi:hypothetical protein